MKGIRTIVQVDRIEGAVVEHLSCGHRVTHPSQDYQQPERRRCPECPDIGKEGRIYGPIERVPQRGQIAVCYGCGSRHPAHEMGSAYRRGRWEDANLCNLFLCHACKGKRVPKDFIDWDHWTRASQYGQQTW